METITNNLYEAMFLIDPAKAGSDWDGVISVITKILEKVSAEIVSIKKWDDRKLAYDIKGQSRGVYILCYFRVNGEKISEIEKNIRLSEQIMRALILNAEQMTEEDIQKDTPATKAEKEDVQDSQQPEEKQELVDEQQEQTEESGQETTNQMESESLQTEEISSINPVAEENVQDSEDSETEKITEQ